MSDNDLIRAHDPFSGHEPPPVVDAASVEEGTPEAAAPGREPAKSETPPMPEKKLAPKRRAPRRRRPSRAEADAAARRVTK